MTSDAANENTIVYVHSGAGPFWRTGDEVDVARCFSIVAQTHSWPSDGPNTWVVAACVDALLDDTGLIRRPPLARFSDGAGTLGERRRALLAFLDFSGMTGIGLKPICFD